jgi:hypothetical protein
MTIWCHSLEGCVETIGPSYFGMDVKGVSALLVQMYPNARAGPIRVGGTRHLWELKMEFGPWGSGRLRIQG